MVLFIQKYEHSLYLDVYEADAVLAKCGMEYSIKDKGNLKLVIYICLYTMYRSFLCKFFSSKVCL